MFFSTCSRFLVNLWAISPSTRWINTTTYVFKIGNTISSIITVSNSSNVTTPISENKDE